jgi:zinc protease
MKLDARFCRLTLLAAAFMLVLTTASQAQNGQPKKVATVEGISEYQYDNGVRLLLFPDESASNITVNMTVLVGSRHEGYGETGMAHLLEHMLFKGSKNFLNPDQALKDHGANPFNGTTWFDRTNYYETMPANDKNLEFGIKFEADRLLHCFIKREDLAKEMTVVRNEFEMGENSPEGILNQRLWATAFEWHNYGKSTIGNKSDIERVPIENLQDFYRRYYRPDNVVMIIAGNFDTNKALDYMTKYFGSMKKPDRPLPSTYTEEPVQDGERTVLLRRVGKVAVVGALYHIPSAAHEDHPALMVLSNIWDLEPNGRLYKALVETKKATSVSAMAWALHDPGAMEISLTVGDGVKPEVVRDEMLQIVENMAKTPVTEEEVKRSKAKYLSVWEQSYRKSQVVATRLTEWVASGDWRLMFLYRDRTEKVTVADVQRVAEKYFLPSNRTVGMFIPTDNPKRTPLPTQPNVPSLVKDYKGREELSAGKAFDVSPANIEANVKRFTLPGGIKVALLPKQTRGQTVVGKMTIRFGNEQSLKGQAAACDFLGPMLARGTRKHTRQQILDTLDSVKSSLALSSDTGSLNVGIQTKRGDLATVLGLAREMLREPSFPQNEFDIMKAEDRQENEKALTDPQRLAVTWVARKINPYPKDDVRYRPTVQESIERLDRLQLKDVVRLYEEQLGGSAGEIVFVGDFDPELVTKELTTMFDGWKAKIGYQRITNVCHTDVKGEKETIQVPDKKNAIYFAALKVEARDDMDDYPAIVMGNYLLGDGFTSRLMERLRQNEGWSYGAGSTFRADSLDKVGTFQAYAICNPDVIDKVDAAVLEEISKLVKQGVSADELEKGKTAYLLKMKAARGNDGTLLEMLRAGLYTDRTFKYYETLEKRIAALSTEDVNQALAKYIPYGRLVIGRAGDFSKNK